MRNACSATVLLLFLCAACAPAATTPAAQTGPLLERGRAWLAIYEWDRAIAAFGQAIDAAPHAAEGYCLRGLAYASAPGGTMGRAAAMADYARCLALAPDGPLAADAQRALAILTAAATAAPAG